MTREEAIVWMKIMFAFWVNTHESAAGAEQAKDLALSALRPVSREQVEWMRGEWINTNKEVEQMCKCSKCGYPISYFWSRTPFCPNCGAPMTDEAVQMLIERLEEMRNGR